MRYQLRILELNFFSPNFCRPLYFALKKIFSMVAKESIDDIAMEDELNESPESESESESGSETEDGEDVKLAEPSKNAINNKDGLLEKLEDIRWPNNVEWIHKLSLDIDGDQEVDVNDDLMRELAFYTQALEGTRQAFDKFQKMGLPFLRPSDYYAEMVKSDSHMVKVKGRLLAEKTRIEEAEERRKQRENKKIAKEVQAQKLKEKTRQKKAEIESVKKWRKQRQQSGFANDNKGNDLDFSFEEGKGFERSNKRQQGVFAGDRSGGKSRNFGGRGKKGSDKKKKGREFKNSKFGYGGKKGLKKQNTAETTNDLRGFNNKFSGNKRKR